MTDTPDTDTDTDTSDTPRLPIQLCVGCRQHLPQDAFTPSVRGRKGYRCRPCQKVANAGRDRTRIGRQRRTYVEKAAQRRSAALSPEDGPGIPPSVSDGDTGPSVGFPSVGWIGSPCRHLKSPETVTERQIDLSARAARHDEKLVGEEGRPARGLAVLFNRQCPTCGREFRTFALLDNHEIVRADSVELDEDGDNLREYRSTVPEFTGRVVYQAPQ